MWNNSTMFYYFLTVIFENPWTAIPDVYANIEKRNTNSWSCRCFASKQILFSLNFRNTLLLCHWFKCFKICEFPTLLKNYLQKIDEAVRKQKFPSHVHRFFYHLFAITIHRLIDLNTIKICRKRRSKTK